MRSLLKPILAGFVLIIFICSSSAFADAELGQRKPKDYLKQEEIAEISIGSWYGECTGYCATEVTIKKDKAILSRRSFEKRFPTATRKFDLPANLWPELVSQIDFDKFNALPERIECPKCDYAGAEFVEIKTKNSIWKTVFVYDEGVAEMEPFLSRLRDLRDNILTKAN